MRVNIEFQLGRRVWNNFRAGLRQEPRQSRYYVITREMIYEYWDQVGTEHNLKVCIRGFWCEFAVIEELEFKSEQDYLLFLLKWS